MDDKIFKASLNMLNVIIDSKEQFDKNVALKLLGELAKVTKCYDAMMELIG